MDALTENFHEQGTPEMQNINDSINNKHTDSYCECTVNIAVPWGFMLATRIRTIVVTWGLRIKK